MGLWDKLRGEFIDIVEWTDNSSDTLVYRFERYDNEIKFGAQLVVRQAQAAVFVNQGQIADVFLPGMYTLETANLPVLSTLQGWKYGFSSPFKAEIYFVSTRVFTDLKWGTKNPVILRDPEFGAVRLRAFGTYAFRVADPVKLIREIVGTDNHFTTDEISEQLRNLIVTRFGTILAGANIPLLDLSKNYDGLAKFITERIAPEFDGYGLQIATMLVENVSLPDEVEQALDRRAGAAMAGDLGRYTQFQAAQALTAAAENEGGLAAGGIGMGIGMMVPNVVGQAMSAPPPLPGGTGFHVAYDGQQAGPFTLEQLRADAQAGRLSATTLVWRQGMGQWQPAAQIQEIAAVLASVPPPLPPG